MLTLSSSLRAPPLYRLMSRMLPHPKSSSTRRRSRGAPPYAKMPNRNRLMGQLLAGSTKRLARSLARQNRNEHPRTQSDARYRSSTSHQRHRPSVEEMLSLQGSNVPVPRPGDLMQPGTSLCLWTRQSLGMDNRGQNRRVRTRTPPSGPQGAHASCPIMTNWPMSACDRRLAAPCQSRLLWVYRTWFHSVTADLYPLPWQTPTLKDGYSSR